jgi:A/G-specific adenine glycosylase
VVESRESEVGQTIADWYAARVVPRLAEWLERWPTPAALAATPPGEAVRAWDRLGYPRRALNLHGAAVAITQQHGGVVPNDVDALLELPGVGPYTARAVAAFAYGARTPVVDTNAERARLTNAGTMELGQVVCTARSPRCEECPLAAACAWRAAGYPHYDGPRASRQKKYEGSDRQVRGLILRELRAADIPVPRSALGALWGDATQLDRALAGLLADGLVTGDLDSGYTLPLA